ncbi:MAG TPA: hypothetical protein VGO61_10785 [Steroidobacteraceae bacterium]|jgi:hypothetical protein|nr:hypothetical protein [Steroidobacteraceae bacterium]
MSTPAPLSESLVVHVGPDLHGYPQARIAAPAAEAANDSTAPDDRDTASDGNPLWLMVAASGCLFATMAVLIALG